MRLLLSVLCVLIASVISADQIVDFVNQNEFGWKAELSKRFEGMERDEIVAMMGFRKDPEMDEAREIVRVSTEKFYAGRVLKDLPENFDARTKWGSCVHPVRDQGQCGSCWAFGATESFSDRLCIASDNAMNFSLSVEQLVSCNLGGLEGCSGGEPMSAFLYTAEWGLPKDECFPYTAGSGTAPPCRSSCVNNEPWVLYYNKLTSIRWHLKESWIREAIYTNGPVEACFHVYEDFMRYKSGIYVHKTGSFLGGHCIKLVGWGVENGMNYWTAQNSWGPDWGEKGFFQIQRGVDMCGIEAEVFSALPIIN